ncbi:MAG: DoxX family membrane protein [Sediminibacterium sp.]|nr:DoxX family membrane protein [uncultured Sediminibacterium sp.]
MQPKLQTILQWVLRFIAAIIMLQTLYFKFSGAEESVYIFTQMGIEPWGRYVTGIAELIASILILYKPLTAFGSLMAVGIMSGALVSHILVLGVVVKNDNGLLFSYALIVWLASVILAWLNRAQLVDFLKKFKKGN